LSSVEREDEEEVEEMKREPEEEARVADENEDEAAERMAPPPHDVNAEELRLIFVSFLSIACPYSLA
jgi:hypothetical protein